MRLLSALFLVFSFSSFANWQLDPANSSLNFISTKNTHFSEVHSFDEFSGQLSASGELSISINLASVNTLIEIRDTRMQDMLFKVDEFATAEFTAELPTEVIATDIGQQNTYKLQGTLSLHGSSVPVSMHVNIARLGQDRFVAHTVKPIILNANQFGLEAGVGALQTIAGLSNISLAVPVTFSVSFGK